MDFKTKDEAIQAVRTVMEDWGAELVCRTVADVTAEYAARCRLNPEQTQRVWEDTQRWVRTRSV